MRRLKFEPGLGKPNVATWTGGAMRLPRAIFTSMGMLVFSSLSSCMPQETECEVSAECASIEVCSQGRCVLSGTDPDPIPSVDVDGGDTDSGVLDGGDPNPEVVEPEPTPKEDGGVIEPGVTPDPEPAVDSGPPCIDVDGDGRGVDCELGPDCDDNDLTIWVPGVGYADADDDGVSLLDPVVLCTDGTMPTGFLASASSPPDCDDASNLISIALDLYADKDADLSYSGTSVSVCTDGNVPAGYLDVAPTQADCDDDDPRRTPGAIELCDALDNSCSGFADDDNACQGNCGVDYSQDPLIPYFFCAGPVSWAGGQSACSGANYQLVVLEDAAENALVSSIGIQRFGGGRWWIGLSDGANEGTFVWVDGQDLAFNGFGGGEPNNDGNEDCVELRETGLWNDVGCGTGRRYICEAVPPPFVP